MTSIKKISAMTLLAAIFTIGSVVPGLAGACGGAKSDGFRLRPYTTHTFNVCFRGGEYARVYVSGDGSSDIDLYIYDEYGRLVAYDNDSSDDCGVEWFVNYTASFTIKVVNRGAYSNDYVILTN